MTPEDVIQQKCIMWFNNTYCLKTQETTAFLFSVPNSGKDKKEQSHKKATGLKAGVSDLILLLPNARTFFIEMKTEKGTQSDSQKEFEQIVTHLGFPYYICRSFDGFQELIKTLLNEI